MSARSNGTPLWEIRWPGGSTIFAGSIEQMAAHLKALHVTTGVVHAAREVRPG